MEEDEFQLEREIVSLYTSLGPQVSLFSTSRWGVCRNFLEEGHGFNSWHERRMVGVSFFEVPGEGGSPKTLKAGEQVGPGVPGAVKDR